jgi:hypothetical protein
MISRTPCAESEAIALEHRLVFRRWENRPKEEATLFPDAESLNDFFSEKNMARMAETWATAQLRQRMVEHRIATGHVHAWLVTSSN